MLGQFAEYLGVIARLHHHGDIAVVLGGGADHRRSADVDVLDAVVVRRALRDGLFERIEIHHQQIDRLDAVRLHRRGVFLVGADRQQPAVHFRMQRLDPAVHHLGRTGEFRHVDDLETGVFERLGGAAGGDQLDAVAGQRFGEFQQAGLVGYRQQSAGDAARVAGHVGWASTSGGREGIREFAAAPGVHKEAVIPGRERSERTRNPEPQYTTLLDSGFAAFGRAPE